MDGFPDPPRSVDIHVVYLLREWILSISETLTPTSSAATVKSQDNKNLLCISWALHVSLLTHLMKHFNCLSSIKFVEYDHTM